MLSHPRHKMMNRENLRDRSSDRNSSVVPDHCTVSWLMSEPRKNLLMHGLPAAALPSSEPLILASGSPRRAELLTAAGYEFTVNVAREPGIRR